MVLLKHVQTAHVAAIENFRAVDHFKVDTKNDSVRINYIGETFKKNFIGLSEGACEATNIESHDLLESLLCSRNRAQAKAVRFMPATSGETLLTFAMSTESSGQCFATMTMIGVGISTPTRSTAQADGIMTCESCLADLRSH